MIGKGKLLLSILLTLGVVTALNFNTMEVSAALYPAIYISPAWTHTDDPASAIGTNYTISVYTNYTGSDVWGYEFTLTFNSSVLEGIEVVNGDLITSDVGPIMWSPGTFDNTAGTLSLTGNGFFALPPNDPPVTSGPGVLANVTFNVAGYGRSDMTLGVETKLIGYDEVVGENFNIIDETMFGHFEDGVFYNRIKGDCNIDRIVDIFDIGFVSAHWYPGPPVGPLGYDLDADVNNDRAVDIFDIGIVSAHWGESY